MALVAAAYAIGVAVWNILRLTPVARWAPFEVADLFAWVMYLPLPLILAGALVLRRRMAVLLLVPFVAFGIEYGPQFSPHRVPDGRPVRVVTANLFSRNARFGDVESTILRSDADVVTLQELDRPMSDSLSARLRGRFPHQALYPGASAEGLGVLSRFPIRDRRRPEMTAGSCRCQSVRIDVGPSEVVVINAHPHRPMASRSGFRTSHLADTVDAISEKVRAATVPVIVAGDMNIGDRHVLYRRIRRVLGDAHRDAGWGLGLTWAHRRRLLLVRIDYVLHDEAWGTRRAWTGPMPGSDHRYVGAELVLKRFS